MSRKKFWVLCISKMPAAKNVTVKILCSQDIPAKGEELAILGQFERKEYAQWVRKERGDKRIIRNWKDGLFIEYSKKCPLDHSSHR